MRGPRPLGCWREGNRTNKVSAPPPAGPFDGLGHIFGYGPNEDRRAVWGSQLGTGSGNGDLLRGDANGTGERGEIPTTIMNDKRFAAQQTEAASEYGRDRRLHAGGHRDMFDRPKRP